MQGGAAAAAALCGVDLTLAGRRQQDSGRAGRRERTTLEMSFGGGRERNAMVIREDCRRSCNASSNVFCTLTTKCEC